MIIPDTLQYKDRTPTDHEQHHRPVQQDLRLRR
jgi:hypothetical protein